MQFDDTMAAYTQLQLLHQSLNTQFEVATKENETLQAFQEAKIRDLSSQILSLQVCLQNSERAKAEVSAELAKKKVSDPVYICF